MPSQILQVSDLRVRYPRRRGSGATDAVDGVSLDIGVGETLGLVGESGSGKSSIGNAVLGLVRVASGRITFADHDITDLRGKRRRLLASQLQAVFQDPYSSLNPHRTVGESVAETTATLPLTAGQRSEQVGEMLERVGLGRSAAHRYPAQFSGGQRQRISIARALMPSPRLVVCDESVSALDLSVQAQILNQLMELQRDLGVSYLFITHDLSVVRHISHRVAVLDAGRIVEIGETARVIDRPVDPYTQRLLAAAPVPNTETQAARRMANRAARALGGSAAGAEPTAVRGWIRDIETLAIAEAVRLGVTDLPRRLRDLGARACADDRERDGIGRAAHQLLLDRGTALTAHPVPVDGLADVPTAVDGPALVALASAIERRDLSAAREAHRTVFGQPDPRPTDGLVLEPRTGAGE